MRSPLRAPSGRRGRGADLVVDHLERGTVLRAEFQRFKRSHHANLLPFVPDHANFACPDALIHADKTLVDTVLRTAICLSDRLI